MRLRLIWLETTIQWRKKMFCCRGAEKMVIDLTMILGSRGMLPQENFNFSCFSSSILVHLQLVGLLHAHDSTAKNIKSRLNVGGSAPLCL